MSLVVGVGRWNLARVDEIVSTLQSSKNDNGCVKNIDLLIGRLFEVLLRKPSELPVHDILVAHHKSSIQGINDE